MLKLQEKHHEGENYDSDDLREYHLVQLLRSSLYLYYSPQLHYSSYGRSDLKRRDKSRLDLGIHIPGSLHGRNALQNGWHGHYQHERHRLLARLFQYT